MRIRRRKRSSTEKVPFLSEEEMARFSINISSLYSKTLIQKNKPYFSFCLSFFLSTCFFALLFFSFLLGSLFFSLLHLIICLRKEREREEKQ